MKVRFTVLCLAGLACLSALAAVAGDKTVKGRGVVRIELDHSEEGSTHVLMALNVDITQGETTKGRFLFAGDDHEHSGGHEHYGPSYPGRVVQLNRFELLTIEPGAVTMRGQGTLNGMPVIVYAKIVDKGEAGDELEVKVSELDGHVTYERQGTLVAGNIKLEGN